MKLDTIRVNRYGNHKPQEKLDFFVTYDKGDYRRAKGIYVSLAPTIVEEGSYGIPICRRVISSNIAESGFNFCVKKIEKASPKLQKEIHHFISENAEWLRDLFNAGRYNDIVEFVVVGWLKT